MEELSAPVQDLFDRNQEMLEQGQSKPRTISFSMWMIGPIYSASPTIVISSRNRHQRTYARTLLKESRLLDKHPGVKIRTLDRMPAVYQGGGPTLGVMPAISSEPNVYSSHDDSIPAVFPARESTLRVVPVNSSKFQAALIDNSRGFCGGLISYGHSKIVTLGGLIRINGVQYGVSAQHAHLDSVQHQDDTIDTDNELCFDEDSDSKDNNLMEIICNGGAWTFSIYRPLPNFGEQVPCHPLRIVMPTATLPSPHVLPICRTITKTIEWKSLIRLAHNILKS